MKKNTTSLLPIGLMVLIVGIMTLVLWLSGINETISPEYRIFFWIGLLVFFVLLIAAVYKVAGKKTPLKSLSNGLPAVATVINSYQGNLRETFGAQVFFKMIIEVNVTGNSGETWSATMKEMIPITQIGVFQPGVSFNVLYDPSNKSKIVFDQSPQTQI